MPPSRIAWLPWVLLATGAGGVLYGMIGFWARGYDSFDRALILVASAWIVRHSRPKLVGLPDLPRPRLGLILLALGTLAFLPPWFVLAQIGPRPVILWWLSLALLAATTGLILIRSGPALLHAVRFPLIFPLFALPLPGRVLVPLQDVLQGIASSIAAEMIPLFGVPVKEQMGNVLLLPTGAINVVQACSGLTQVRTILAIAAIIAHVRGFGLVRSAVTVLLGIPIIVVVNSLRVTASGLIGEWAGYCYVEDPLCHELLGVSLFLIGLSLVLGLTHLLRRPGDLAEISASGEPTMPARSATAIATVLLTAAVMAGIGSLFVEGAARSNVKTPEFANVPSAFGQWRRFGDDLAIPEEIQSTLTSNAALHRVYTPAGIGFEKADIWLLYWKSAMVVKDYHHPDLCYAVRGDTILVRRVEAVTTPGGRSIAMTYREIQHGDSVLQLVYWTQEGRRIWTDADEAEAASFLFPFIWLNKQHSAPKPRDACDDRLVMMVGMPLFKHGSPTAQKVKLLDAAGRLADEVYTLCPWADPKTP